MLKFMNNLIKPQEKSINQFQLTPSEIELILTILGESQFPIKRINELYQALYKLQEQHSQLIKLK